MHRPGFILLIEIVIISSIQCQFRGNYDVNKISAEVVERLQSNNLTNNIPVDVVNVIREVRPENVIKANAIGNLNRTVQEWIVNDTKCDTQFSIFVNGVMTSELWALKMVDSSSKIPSGNLIGNMKDLGFYDECVSVEVTRNQEVIRGRHCMYSLSIRVPNTTVSLRSTMSICLPAACDSDHVGQLVQNAVNATSGYHDFELELKSATCSAVDPPPWENGDIIAISILTIFVGFLIFCTICDILRVKECRIFENNVISELSKFSLYTNGKRVLDTTVPRGTLPAIQGIRFFSMCWVIIGHEYVTLPLGAVTNMVDIGEWITSWGALYILIAPFAVDTFFVLSGFLTSYLFLKETSGGRKFNVIMYYVHRYVRLTPALGALLLLTIYVFPRIGSGALWETSVVTQRHLCSKNWWPMLLYVHNYVNTDYMWCLGHTWYLAVDMQFFWISPLILYPMVKKSKLGVIILLAFVIASVITPAVIAAENQFSGSLFTLSNLPKIQDTMLHFYVTSYTRAGPWLLGITLGWVLSKRQFPPPQKLMYCGWILTILMFAFAFFTYRIFQSPGYEWNPPWEVFYAALGRHIWAFSICWIIYASALGYGGVLSKFLSLPIFIPFGRISYSIYLVHFILLIMKIGAIRTPTYFSDFRIIYTFFGDFVICTFGGFIFSLLFESPFMVIEKLFFGNRRIHQRHETKEIFEEREVSAKNDIQREII
ncbi:nose resistant to fluoxetine protein 6-like [Diachasmimorpha longicaudata]|uniref:nose resistant to fluoxetine protein 6-like n=1 Tax=Diachasmimorpha longicaudata TaxID=58733 RepID=UPI0030B86CCC